MIEKISFISYLLITYLDMFLMLCGVLVTSLPLQKPVIGVYTTDGSAHN